MRGKSPLNAALGILTEILYAFTIIGAAFLICVMLSFKI